ncbi:HEAT repeat domain-containing protein [Maioricimonas rarisocia]|uniref:HEAT repeat domain-containing protein n=1 Tax=Maioricimonas rarisocia TaxID=2528026 RepID=UPI0018D24055|nr:HEAT repeat domain-containing protein [Maioricimonas rarisocia]
MPERPSTQDLDELPSLSGSFDLDQMLSMAEDVSGSDTETNASASSTVTDEAPTAPQPERAKPAPPVMPSPAAAPPEAAESSEADSSNASDSRIPVQCGGCQRRMRVPRTLAGRTVKCPGCGEGISVPGESTPRIEKRSGSSGSRSNGRVREAEESAAPQSSQEIKTLREAIERACEAPAPDPPAGEDAEPESAEETETGRKGKRKKARGNSTAPRKLGPLRFRSFRNHFLAGADPEARNTDREAAQASLDDVAASKDPRIVELITEHFDDLKGPLQARAIRALGEIGVAESFPFLLKLLLRKEESIVTSALLALGLLADPRAVLPVVTLAQVIPEQRVRAIDCLVRMGPAAVPELIRILRESDDLSMQFTAVEALGRIKAKEAAEPLAGLLKNSIGPIRCAAAEALGQIADPRASAALVQLLGCPDPNVRVNAVAALEQMPQKRLAKPLLRLLQDDMRDVRLHVIRTLGLCEDPSVAPSLIPFLNDSDEDLQLAAAEATGRLGDSSAVPKLIELMEQASVSDLDAPRLQKIIDTLRRLRDGRAVLPLLELLTHKNHRVRARAAEALGQIGDPAALQPLSELLYRDQIEMVQAAAAKALGDLGDPEALTALEHGLQQPLAVRSKAIIAIGQIQEPEAAEMVMEMLDDPASAIRYHAVTILGELGDDSVTPKLERLIVDSDDMVRRAVLKSLEQLGDTRDEAAIRKAIKNNRKPRRGRRQTTMVDLVPSFLAGVPVVAGSAAAGVIVAVGLLVWWMAGSGEEKPLVLRGDVVSVGMSGDGSRAVAARKYGLFEVWDIAGENVVQQLTDLPRDAVLLNADGSRMLCASKDASYLVDLTSKEILANDVGMSGAQALSDRSRAVTFNDEGLVVVWDISGARVDQRVDFGLKGIRTVKLTPDGSRCVAAAGKRLLVWNFEQQSIEHEIVIPRAEPAVTAVAISPDGQTIVTGHRNGSLLLWPAGARKPSETLPSPGRATPVVEIEYIEDNRLACALNQQFFTVALPSGEAKEIKFRLAGTITSVTIDSSGSRAIIASSDDSPLAVLDLKGAKKGPLLDLPY